MDALGGAGKGAKNYGVAPRGELRWSGRMLASFPHLLARSHGFTVSWSLSIPAILALVAGLLILIRPKLLNFIVAAYLIAIGLMGLIHLRW